MEVLHEQYSQYKVEYIHGTKRQSSGSIGFRLFIRRWDSIRPQVDNSEEALCLIGSMSDKLSSINILPTSLLKSGIEMFNQVIALLSHISISRGTFAERFKKAQITPLLMRHGPGYGRIRSGQLRTDLKLELTARSLNVGSWPQDPPTYRFIAEFHSVVISSSIYFIYLSDMWHIHTKVYNIQTNHILIITSIMALWHWQMLNMK